MTNYCEPCGCGHRADVSLESNQPQRGDDFAVSGFIAPIVAAVDAAPGNLGLHPDLAESCARWDHAAAVGLMRGRPEFGLEIIPSEYPVSTRFEDDAKTPNKIGKLTMG